MFESAQTRPVSLEDVRMLWMVQPRQERQSTFTSRAFLIMKSLRPVKVINLMLVCLIAQKSRDNSFGFTR
jgi:hypothetical protein